MSPSAAFSQYQIACKIPASTNTSPTDIICLFASKGSEQPSTTNSVRVTCIDPEKSYIPLDPTPVTDVKASHNQPVQYYTTQGTLLPGRPTHPGIYIVRQGNNATKQVIK